MTQLELFDAPALSSQPTYSPATVLPHFPTPSEDIAETYEILRTVDYVHSNNFRRVALQFPDELLRASTRVVELLTEGLHQRQPAFGVLTQKVESLGIVDKSLNTDSDIQVGQEPSKLVEEVKFYILADTSYGSCCVDEIAAEHAEADCIIHYGRACLSSTLR